MLTRLMVKSVFAQLGVDRLPEDRLLAIIEDIVDELESNRPGIRQKIISRLSRTTYPRNPTPGT